MSLLSFHSPSPSPSPLARLLNVSISFHSPHLINPPPSFFLSSINSCLSTSSNYFIITSSWSFVASVLLCMTNWKSEKRDSNRWERRESFEWKCEFHSFDGSLSSAVCSLQGPTTGLRRLLPLVSLPLLYFHSLLSLFLLSLNYANILQQLWIIWGMRWALNRFRPSSRWEKQTAIFSEIPDWIPFTSLAVKHA